MQSVIVIAYLTPKEGNNSFHELWLCLRFVINQVTK